MVKKMISAIKTMNMLLVIKKIEGCLDISIGQPIIWF